VGEKQNRYGLSGHVPPDTLVAIEAIAVYYFKAGEDKWISWFYLPSDGLRLFDPYGTMAGAAWRGGTYLASVVYAGGCHLTADSFLCY
jgi:hypothetical protein